MSFWSFSSIYDIRQPKESEGQVAAHGYSLLLNPKRTKKRKTTQ